MEETSFERLVNIQSYSDEELKELARQLSQQEAEISKRRRLLQGEIDILRAEMVRRLRGRHNAGETLVTDGDVEALVRVLSSHPARDESPREANRAATGGMDHVVSGIQKRFRDFSVDVREERVIRYIVKQVRLGRHINDIMADAYLVEHTSDPSRASLLQNPAVLKAVEEEIRHQFADLRSVTGPEAEGDASE